MAGGQATGPNCQYFDFIDDEIISKLGISWSLRDYHAESYMFAKVKDGLEDTKSRIMASDRVINAIDELCTKEGISEKEATQRATSILEETAHTFNINTIRFMAFLLSKIVKKMFRHVYVNKTGVVKLSDAVKYAPLVLVPSHNSYFDFLLTSLICFANDLPLPAIASGQDFLNIAIVNRLLRGSGAYFLRRSFASDAFYRSIFTEYVQQLIKEGQMPIEFFLEGTRSRSGKALNPKTGMLSMITEMFFLGHVPDIYFCPISISYECISEEQLYVFELLGIPKPKESLHGLVKARKVLSADYGSVYFHFGDIVSLRDYCEPSINRAEYALFPRHQTKFKHLVHTTKEKKVVHRLAQYLVHCQQAGMMIYPRSVVASAVLQNISDIDDVVDILRRVQDLLKMSHRPMHGMNGTSINESIRDAVMLSKTDIHLSENKIVSTQLEIPLEDLKSTAIGASLDRTNKLSRSIAGISLSLQRNKLMDALLIPSLVAAVGKCVENETMSFHQLLADVAFLHETFQPEFVRHPDIEIIEDLERTLNVLEANSCIRVVGQNEGRYIQRITPNDILLRFLQGLIRPFIETYWLVGQCLMISEGGLPCSLSSLVSQLQLLAASTLSLGIVDTCEVISLVTLKNGVNSFAQYGCVERSTNVENEAVIQSIDRKKLWTSVTRLGHLAGLADVCLYINDHGSVRIKSKM